MRKINSILAIIALSSIAVVSCKKDDPASSTAAYIGSWKETHFVASGCTDPGDNEDYSCTVTECATITITATTITIVSPTSGTSTYNYTASGTTFTVTGSGITGSMTVTAVVSGTTLTVTSDGSPGCTNVSTYTKI